MFKAVTAFGVILLYRLRVYITRYAGFTAVVLRLLKHYERAVAVDLGSGVGYMARMVSKASGMLVVAVDVRRYDKWNSDGGEEVDYLQADVRYLPLKSGGVYFVYALSLLEHVEGWERVIREAFRVLKCSGLFLVQIPNFS